MNRFLFLAALLLVGCTQQDPAVDDAAHRATSEPRATATPPTSTATPPASASAGVARRTPFGTNLAHAPRDPNSVFMHAAADFLAKLRSRGYVLAPTQLPEPHPAASGYAVEGISVTLAVAEEERKLRVAGLIVPAADLQQADSSTAELMWLVTQAIAGVSRDKAESQRLRIVREHEARVRQSGDSLGTRSNPVMLHYAPGPNDALRLSFTKGPLLSERPPLSPSRPNQTPNPNRPMPGPAPTKILPKTPTTMLPANPTSLSNRRF